MVFINGWPTGGGGGGSGGVGGGGGVDGGGGVGTMTIKQEAVSYKNPDSGNLEIRNPGLRNPDS